MLTDIQKPQLKTSAERDGFLCSFEHEMGQLKMKNRKIKFFSEIKQFDEKLWKVFSKVRLSLAVVPVEMLE